MKTSLWLVIGALLSMSLLAQQDTNAPAAIAGAAATAVVTNQPAAPAPAQPPPTAPAKKKATAKKSTPTAAKKKAAPELKTVPLTPGPATVVASNVNVRGQAKLRSEVVTKVTKGQTVTVLEEIVRNDSAPDEPSAWAKILLPESTPVWVNSMFIDANKTVVPNRLNLRSGPGENFSILGRIEKGYPITELRRRDDWIEIQAPTNAFAFVAAQFLKQEQAASSTPAEPPMPAEPPALVDPAPTPATVTEQPAIANAPTEAPPLPTPPAPTPPTEVASAVTNASVLSIATNEAPELVEEPLPRRIVRREGVVRGTVSIQAPTHFSLVSPVTGRLINYLYTSSPSLDLRRYKGLKVMVEGEEALEERWGNTPVITIHTIEPLDE